MRAGDEVDVLAAAREHLAAAERPSLRRVLNATGVIVHTNLGRAPLPAAAREAAAAAAARLLRTSSSTSSGGARGSRQAHVERLLRELTGAEAALAVNNGAAAVLLAAAALAGPGREVVVSRGQLVEIGGSFRIPDVIAQSGVAAGRGRHDEPHAARRLRARDRRRAPARSCARTQSNFRTRRASSRRCGIEALCALGPPVIDDVGSGALAEGLRQLADEPLGAPLGARRARRSCAARATSCSAARRPG